MSNVNSQYVFVYAFNHPNDLFVISGRLEAEDIDFYLSDELTIQVDPFLSNALGGVKLFVQETYLSQVIEILRENGYSV